MTRIRLTTGRAVLFLSMVLAALLVLLPLRLVLAWAGLGDTGMAARSVSGTVWRGTLTETRFGDLALGDLSARMSPLALLLGRARIDVTGRDTVSAPRLAGAITLSRHRLGIDDTTASIPVGDAFVPLPISALDLSDVSVHFADGQCEEAEGRVQATLTNAVAGIPIGGQMSGPVRCEAGALLLPLTGRSGVETADLRMWQDGRYRAELTLNPDRPEAGAVLQAMGFVQTQQGWRLSVDGRF